VKNDPPKIFVSEGPAILLLTDGKPVRSPIKKTKLEFVVNTNWDLFFDKSSSKYYLLHGKQWLTARDLNGPWAVTHELPKDMSKLPSEGNENWADVKQAIPPPAGNSVAPKVLYSDMPAELIAFKGKPVFSKIPGTELVYASNTDSDLFVDSRDQQYYYLVSGRWFRAKSLDGPWSFATPNLPADFAKIPPNSARSRVLASVPGTQEAKDAVLLAQVPNTVIVNPAQAEAQVKVAYDGEPQFKPIEGTSLSYATNTQDKIIKVGDLYYLCFQGIWFMSKDPNGPWKTAESVPKEIYSIPASSPVYNVTYVTQNTNSDGDVEASQTAGYLGMFLVGTAVGLTVAYGSGWYYPPYVYYGGGYPIYRPYPYTYGVGYAYNSYYGYGRYGAGYGAYGPYGGIGGSAYYNSRTGTYGRTATAYGPYGSRTAGRAYNPYTGAYGATRQGSNAYSQWGASAVTRGDKWATSQHVTTAQGTRARMQTSEGGRAVAGRGAYGQGFAGVTGSGDVYAGRDGNVYRKSGDSWQRYDNGSWNNASVSPETRANTQQRAEEARASRPEGTSSMAGNSSRLSQEQADSISQRRSQSSQSSTMSDLNRESQARQRGTQQTQRFQSSSRSSRGFGGGGGRRGGRR
jgi:hypothetical protein